MKSMCLFSEEEGEKLNTWQLPLGKMHVMAVGCLRMSGFVPNIEFSCVHLFGLVVTRVKLALKVKAEPLKSRCVI